MNARPLLLALSLAVTTRLSAQAGMILGTPAYMSPEQCMGDADVSSLSDIYSLGALGYFLVVGRSPFGVMRSFVQ
jgi:serine/threonine protein kinase